MQGIIKSKIEANKRPGTSGREDDKERAKATNKKAKRERTATKAKARAGD